MGHGLGGEEIVNAAGALLAGNACGVEGECNVC
jgi:hypothetical protein